MRIVTVSSGEMTIQAFTSRVAGSSYQLVTGAVCASARDGTQKPSTKAPWAAATVARNSRRVTPAAGASALESQCVLWLTSAPTRYALTFMRSAAR